MPTLVEDYGNSFKVVNLNFVFKKFTQNEHCLVSRNSTEFGS